MGWSNWDDGIGGVIIGAPAVASYASGRLDVFVRDTNNHMQHRSGDGDPAHWSDWDSIGGVIISSPAAVSWGNNRIDCFAAGAGSGGTDSQGFTHPVSYNHLFHISWDNVNGWSGWDDLSDGIPIVGTPAAASWDSGRLDVFVRDTSNRLQHKSYDGGWSGWDSEAYDGQIFSSPAAVSWGRNRIDCFAADTDNRLLHIVWDGNRWSSDYMDGEVNIITDTPAVASWDSNRLDVFFRGTDSRIHHKVYNGAWHKVAKESPLNDGIFASGPCAVSQDSNRIDCFAANGDNQVNHTSWS